MEKDKLSTQRLIFGAFLEDMRKTKKQSRSQLAKTLGLTEQVIEEWEQGKRRMDITELRAYCKAVNLPLADCVIFMEKVFDKIPDD